MIYNILLSVFILGMAPKILWDVFCHSKKVPSIKDRLGIPTPKISGEGRRIWVHAVSLGEMKAAQPIIERLHASDPNIQFLITTATATGHGEADRLFSHYAVIRFLPFDFSWIMRRWVSTFRPHTLIFIEGDIWPNLIKIAQEAGVKTALVSGKISEKSTKRYKIFPKIAKRLFGSLDLLCVQNEEFRDRFKSIVKRPIIISGNLKLDIQPSPVNIEAVRKRFSLTDHQHVITISCTHAPEEKELLLALQPVLTHVNDLVIFLAPRHPERFNEVAAILKHLKISFCRWTESREQQKVVLVDIMGQLASCYSISQVTIVAGSFSSMKGGHNLIEPCLYGCPVLFGPYTHTQKELVQLVSQAHVGKMVSSEILAQTVLEWFSSSEVLRANIHRFIDKNRGSADRTFQLIEDLLK